MCTTSPGLRPLVLPDLLTRWIVGLFIAFSLMMAGMVAHAAPPPAGQSISNQASATYLDASGTTQTVSSNIVLTTVQQIASLTLVASDNKMANPGGVVNYPHTLTNTGNGNDTFNLTTGNTGGFTMTGVVIYAADSSGAPTGPAITSTGVLTAGASFKFVVQGSLPAGATVGQTNDITVTGTSVFDPTKTQSNTDRTTVTNGAVLTLSKVASVSNGPVGTVITYTLNYSNTGNATANTVAITDILQPGLDYVANSATWNGTALSDSNGSIGTAPNTATSSYTLGTKTLLVTLNQITPTQTGNITFQVKVATGTAPGTLNNKATLSYNDGPTPVTVSSALIPFTVLQTASVTMTPPAAVASAPAGTTVTFSNVLTNTGNATDSFNITVGANTFPAGTTFEVYQSNGSTLMSSGNTGPILAGQTYNVIVKAILLPGATGTGPFTVAKTATSVFDPTKSATAIDTLTAISPASVDATNNLPTAAGVPGAGVFANGEGAAQVTNTLNPNASTTFTIVANNTGLSSDAYDLGASTVANFGSTTLPGGWTVSFKANVAGSCSTTGATITNTGPVAAGGNVVVCAVVNVPLGFAAGTYDLYFRTKSPTSNASDTLHDAVTVNAMRSIAISPPSLSGQASPGGSIVYTHTVTNTGNVTEGGTFSAVALTSGNNQSGWTTSLFYDTNSNGVLDGADLGISGNLPTLAPGATITIFNKVVAPASASTGAVNVTTITATTTNLSYGTTVPAVVTATDHTSVGNLTLTKAQALDATCDGTPDTAYGATPLSAQPGQCVRYQITVTNSGTASATSVVVSDATPAYTTLSSPAGGAPATTVGTVTSPAAGSSGSISATVGTLAAGQSAVVTFGVRITP
jgi:uncharacterized repeat protein (TIGR01451 family)